jgi:predicted nucleic acid-binding protein
VVKVVIDASAALSWCYVDEKTPESSRLLEFVNLNGAVVPNLWHLEVANALLVGEIRERLTYATLTGLLDYFDQLPITVDHATSELAWKDILSIARNQKLTTYDASYVELAMRLNLPLATNDQAMIKAASAIGVEVFKA